MTLDMLQELGDGELHAIIARCQELLAEHDRARKDKALSEARATLLAVGLSLKDLNGKGKGKAAKGPSYHTGHQYQHPTNKGLNWNGKGKKPGWIIALETQGEKAVEVANDNIPPLVKKAG